MSALGQVLRTLNRIERDRMPTPYAQQIARWNRLRLQLMAEGLSGPEAHREAERRVFGRVIDAI